MLIAGELGIKDQGGVEFSVDLFPKGYEIQDLLGSFGAKDIGLGVLELSRLAVLGKKGQSALEALAPGGHPMGIQDSLLPPVRDTVEIQVDRLGPIGMLPVHLPDEPLQQPVQHGSLQPVGVIGDGSGLGQSIESGKQPHPFVKIQVVDLTEPLFANEFEGQKRQKVLKAGICLDPGSRAFSATWARPSWQGNTSVGMANSGS